MEINTSQNSGSTVLDVWTPALRPDHALLERRAGAGLGGGGKAVLVSGRSTGQGETLEDPLARRAGDHGRPGGAPRRRLPDEVRTNGVIAYMFIYI